jgi:WD40 repeat protein
VIVYDFKNKKILREFSMGDSYADSIAFTADEKAIMVYDDGVKCWGITTGQLIYHIDVDYFGFVTSNRDRSLHLTQHDDSDSVSVWNAASGKFLYRVKHPNVREVVISDDNTRLLTGDGIGFGVVWNTATLQPVSLLMEKITGIWDISFDPASNNFIPFTNSKTVSLRNLNTGRELNKLKLKGLPHDGEFSNNGRLVLIISTDSTATAWDTKTGKVLRTIKSAKSGIHSAVFSGDDKKILITEDRFLKLYNVADGKIIRQIPAPTGDFIRASMSQDGKFIAAYCYGNNSKGYKTLLAKRVKIFDAATGKLVRSVDGHKDLGVSSLTFSQSGRKIAMATYDSLLVFDLSVPSSKPVRKFNPDGALWKVVFSPYETKLLTTHNNTAPRLWNASDGKLIRQFDIPYEGELFSAIFTRDGTKFLTTASDNVIRVCDAETGSVICSMRDSVAALQTAQFNFDETRVITWSDNQSIKYWDYSRCSALFDMYATDENNLVYKLPNGYYMASPQASKLLHYVTEDLEVIGFDQLDLRFNRPDKVLQATSPGDTALIRAYYNAWQKRITRLGYDTSGFDSRLDIPGADFRERNTIAYDNRTGKLTLGISATDSLHPLERFNVWVNEVPVFGSRGVDISIKHTQVFDTTLSIGLSTGKNIIETAVSNVTGLQSFKSPLQVHYTPLAKKDKMYFVGIGIDRFRDSTYNLRWSVKDIRDLAKALKKMHGEHIIIDTLYNEDVTVENVKRLRNTLTQAGADDKVIVAYSGHGLLSKGYDYYLSTYAVDFDNPQQHGLSYDVLEGLLDGLASRRKLMLIDACHSGEVDKEELARYERIQATLDSTKKGVSLNLRKKRESMGTINSFELMQELFANVGRGTGATIISAAGGTQFALERGDLENGVFTYTILELMKKNKPTFLSQLKQHVNERVVELTRGAQVPTTRTENVVVDWEVW